MFSLRQIAVGGFCGVYAGCMALTVNLMRIPYRRGAVIGAIFGPLAQLMIALIDVGLALLIGNALDDAILKLPSTWAAVIASYAFIQILSAVGCTIMGKYFLSPPAAGMPFPREKLLAKLSARDTGKTSVLHDVVLKLQSEPAREDKSFSNGWILFGAVLSLAGIYAWVSILANAILDVLFFGTAMDFAWGLTLFGKSFAVLTVLIAVNLSVLAILGMDVRKPQ